MQPRLTRNPLPRHRSVLRPTAGLLNTKANQITYAYGSLIRTDSLFSLCYPVQTAPAAVCQNGVMDYVLHPIEPLTIRITLAGAF
jgi:hypothetical protein